MTPFTAHDVFYFDWKVGTMLEDGGYTISPGAAALLPQAYQDVLSITYAEKIYFLLEKWLTYWREQQAPPETITLPDYDVDGYPDLQEVGFFKRKDNATILYYGGVFTHQELKDLGAKDQE